MRETIIDQLFRIIDSIKLNSPLSDLHNDPPPFEARYVYSRFDRLESRKLPNYIQTK